MQSLYGLQKIGVIMKKVFLSLVFIVLIIFISTTFLSAQESECKLYRIYTNKPSEIKQLAKQGFDIYHIQQGKYVEVLTHPEKIDALNRNILKVAFIANSFKEQLQQELGETLSEYHDYRSTYQELKQISSAFSEITRLDTIGYSVEGRILSALKVSDNPDVDEDEPPILIIGCHHGNEILSVEAPLVFIHYLIDNYGSNPKITNWINTMEIWFIPLLNPDGREQLRRYNNRDVDLNRNYSFQFTAGGTHGPKPFSEPETQSVRNFVQSHRPILCLTYHTSGRLVLYNWTHTAASAPDKPILTQIGGAIADSLNYELRQGGQWYFTAGEFTDFMYGAHGAVAFTVEMYRTQTPPASVIDEVIERNLPGFISLLDQVNKSGLTGLVTDTVTGNAVAATINIPVIPDQGLLFERKSEPKYGRYYRYLVPGYYTIDVSAPGYSNKTFNNVLISGDSLTLLNISLSPTALVTMDNYQIVDDSTNKSSGNNDGIININETISLSVILKNEHQVPAKNVFAKILSSSPYVNLLRDSVFFGDVEINNPKTVEHAFNFYVLPTCPDGESLNFIIDISDSNGAVWSQQFSLPVSAPVLSISFLEIFDPQGNDNKVLNNGEAAWIHLGIKNTGHQPVSGLISEISSTNQYLQIINNSDHLFILEIGQDSTLKFQLSLDPTTPKNQIIDCLLKINTAELFKFEAGFQLHNVEGLFENFEIENSGWTHRSVEDWIGGRDDWQWGTAQGKGYDPAGSFSGEKCWGTDLGYDLYAGKTWDGYYENSSNNYLKSPTINCTGLFNVGLKYRRWLNLRMGDEARIRVNETIVWQSPNQGIRESQWKEHLVDISSVADNLDSVIIKFELFSDEHLNSGGWNIDDVYVASDLITNIAMTHSNLKTTKYQLYNNYPNPFNPSTTIRYDLSAGTKVHLKIYNLLGKVVRTLVDNILSAGEKSIVWDGKDDFNRAVPSGIYLYQIRAGAFTKTKKMIMIK
jgi:hypothetical protein